ncbi:MAG: GatB/YqeY domain-containing protein [Patescibacteria group bacterium]
MNPLKEKINSDLKEALKAGDAFRRSLLGMIKAAIQNKEIEKKKKEEGLTEAETQEVIRSEAKKRLDSATTFRTAGEEERAASEEVEVEILKKYLPPEASAEDIKKAVDKAMAEVGSKSKKDFGKIMGLAVKELAGRADGNRVKNILEPMLE